MRIVLIHKLDSECRRHNRIDLSMTLIDDEDGLEASRLKVTLSVEKMFPVATLHHVLGVVETLAPLLNKRIVQRIDGLGIVADEKRLKGSVTGLSGCLTSTHAETLVDEDVHRWLQLDS